MMTRVSKSFLRAAADQHLRFAAILSLCLTISTPACANVGIPMLALAWPAQWLALVPVIIIETAIARRVLNGTFDQFLKPIAKANLLSTLIGIPVAWLFMMALELIFGLGVNSVLPEKIVQSKAYYYLFFPFFAAWVGDKPWEVFWAAVVLSVPFGAASVYLEYRSLKRALAPEFQPRLWKAVVVGNVATYSLLVISSLLIPLTA